MVGLFSARALASELRRACASRTLRLLRALHLLELRALGGKNAQVIDTPGILDHPLEDRNTIEMTVTAQRAWGEPLQYRGQSEAMVCYSTGLILHHVCTVFWHNNRLQRCLSRLEFGHYFVKTVPCAASVGKRRGC